ncbi:MAG TPA: hypothetical protein DCS01_04825 [Idiomarina abyssalis]|jgi:hypothetical protein|uniref:hypothetical protein n=1 Tax=Idiomarina TaxID=135575 RepID=UPI000C43FB0E|nr:MULTISPECIES: hypothetical protein [Idiomarina]MAB22034.1 hypothetical protein [Idiomarina sp.]MBE93413.1 hypothetical protein [Idiomarina sp.]HAS14602.1 hypothetical protein [Idiomarina abyssalis]|tara:strand:- start:1228 stop:1632 length:405 start_codon:yes stop_codon:yes gene_type:complete
MIDTAKQYAFQAAKITITAVMLCVLCWLLFSNPDSTTNTQFAVADTVVTSEVSDGAAVSASPYSSASQFEHHKQSANWQFERIDETKFSVLVANIYLLTEPILTDWFLIKPSSRFHLSGWKDVGMQFKIKNAFI